MFQWSTTIISEKITSTFIQSEKHNATTINASMHIKNNICAYCYAVKSKVSKPEGFIYVFTQVCQWTLSGAR